MRNQSDRDAEATAAAEDRARQILGRAMLRRISSQIKAWDEEERTAKRISLWLGLVFFSLFALLAIVSYALNAHPKIQLFLLALGIGVIAAMAMIGWSRMRKR